MTLADEAPAASSIPTATDPYLAGLLEAGLAALGESARFSAAVAVICRDGQTEAYVCGADEATATTLVDSAMEGLHALAGGANRDCASPGVATELDVRPNGPSLNGAPVAAQDAPIVLGGVVRGLVRLCWPADAPGGASGLYPFAQAVSSALESVRAGVGDGAFLELAESLGDGLVAVDAEGSVAALNEAGGRLLAALGQEDGAPPPAVSAALSKARETGSPALMEVTAQTPESRHITIAALSKGGGGLVALRDDTEERLLQERLLQSEKMASVGQLVSGVAHELNNPLTGVMGFAQLLLARDLEETVRAQIQTIYGEAERAAKIVQNLLSFARRRKAAKEMADVNALLQRVIELRSYDFTIRDISLDMTLDSKAPLCWVDPDQIQQVFFNVIKNAEQAMIDSRGGGKLTVRTGASRTGIRVEVQDQGSGIPPEIQRRIFDPFFTTKEAGQGTGLGLTICYSIIDEHGGRIWVESPPGGGALFSIEIPAGVAEESEPLAAGPTASSPKIAGGLRVLVVDDEESIRMLLKEILRLDRHRVVTASSGQEAAQRVAGEPFDVIITDMKMPGMDGAAFYRQVREHDPDLARRMIFITGDTVSPDTRAFLQRVSNPVLSKPFKMGPLREAIETVLAG